MFIVTAVITILLSFVPAIIYINYIYNKIGSNLINSENIKKIFFFGLLSPIFVFILHLMLPFMFIGSNVINTTNQAFFKCFFEIGPFEEIAKLLSLLFAIKFLKIKNITPIQIMFYFILISGAFAGLENVLYGIDGGLLTLFSRNSSAVIMHLCLGTIMGYYFAIGLIQEHKDIRYFKFFLGIFWASNIHALYDFNLMNPSNNNYSLTSRIILVASIIISSFLLKEIKRHSIDQINQKTT